MEKNKVMFLLIKCHFNFGRTLRTQLFLSPIKSKLLLLQKLGPTTDKLHRRLPQSGKL